MASNGPKVDWCLKHGHEAFDSINELGKVCEDGARLEGRWDCLVVSATLTIDSPREEKRMTDWSRETALQMRDRLLFDEWEPHSPPEYPGDEDTLRFRMFRLFDEAYDLLVGVGMEPEEATITVRVLIGTEEGPAPLNEQENQ